MKTRRSSKLNESPNSISVTKEEDSVVEESHVLLDFTEFHSTSIFQDSTFKLVSSDTDKGCVYKIDNCCFDTICFNHFDSKTPTCLINDYLPLNGSHISDGMTYILIDRDSINNPTDPKSEDNSEFGNGINVCYTNKCIEFSTDK